MTSLRKLTLIALTTLGIVAGTSYADDARAEPAAQVASPPTATIAAPAPAPAPAAEAKPSDELTDPITDPAGTYADLVGAKQRGGWALLVLGVLVVLTRLLARVGGSIGAWFGAGTRGVVVAAVAAMAVGAYDALALGGSWAGVIIAALGAALALWHPVPPQKEPPGLARATA